jgi:hydroxypyruvate isomerase
MKENTMADDAKRGYSRRGFLAGGAVACATGVVATRSLAADTKPDAKADAKPEIPPEDFRIQNGRIRQSVMGWCFKMPTGELIDACHRLGMPAMEGINAKFYPKLREKKMVPAIVGSHGLKKGPLNSDHHAMCIEKMRAGIDKAAEFGSPGVIVFTGMREKASPTSRPTATASSVGRR